jgi:hypothetical protein
MHYFKKNCTFYSIAINTLNPQMLDGNNRQLNNNVLPTSTNIFRRLYEVEMLAVYKAILT